MNQKRLGGNSLTRRANAGKPVIVWGNGQHGSTPVTPEEEPIENIQPLCTVALNGWQAIQTRYAELAKQNGWPDLGKLAH